MTQAAMDNDTMVAVTPCPSCGAPCEVNETAATEVWVNDDFGNPHLETRLGLKRYRFAHQSGRTGAGEALREALNDTQSTMSALKAEATANGGRATCLWIADQLHKQMVANAALKDTPDE